MGRIQISAKDFHLICPKCKRIASLFVVLRLRFDFGCSECKTPFKEFDAVVESSKLEKNDDWWRT